MPEKTNIQLISGYFGKKPGETLQELMAEMKSLSDNDKLQLASGIRNGTMTY